MSDQEKKQRKVFSPWKFIVALGAAIGIIASLINDSEVILNKAKEFVGINKIIPNASDSTFDILIVRFNDITDKKDDVAQDIRDRLQDLKENDSLNINIFYTDEKVSYNNHTTEMAKSMMEKYHGNMIIYGKIRENHDLVVVKYLTDSTFNKKSTLNNYVKLELSEMRNGELQGGIDDIVYSFAGFSQFNLNKFKKAIYYFNKISEEGHGLKARIQLSIGHLQLGELENARTNCLLALEMDSLNYLTHMVLGMIYENQKDSSNLAIKQYKKCIELDSTNQWGYFSLGSAYSSIGEKKKSIDAYEKILELDSANYCLAHEGLGTKYLGDNDEKAIYHMEKTLACDSEAVHLYYNLGNAYLNKGEIEKTIEAYEQFVSKAPDTLLFMKFNGARTYIPYVNLGNYYLQKDNNLAEKYYQKAIKLDPNFSMAYSWISVVHIFSEKNDLAEKYANLALDKDSTNQLAKDCLREVANRRENTQFSKGNKSKNNKLEEDKES